MDRKRHTMEDKLKDLFSNISDIILKNNARINGIMEVLYVVFTIPIIGKILQERYQTGVKYYLDAVNEEEKRTKAHFIQKQKEFDARMLDLAMEAEWPEETSDDGSGVH